eukprot:32353-Pyramimonas_sp.AAC.1
MFAATEGTAFAAAAPARWGSSKTVSGTAITWCGARRSRPSGASTQPRTPEGRTVPAKTGSSSHGPCCRCVTGVAPSSRRATLLSRCAR